MSIFDRKENKSFGYLCVHVFVVTSLICICVFAIVFALLLAGRQDAEDGVAGCTVGKTH